MKLFVMVMHQLKSMAEKFENNIMDNQRRIRRK